MPLAERVVPTRTVSAAITTAKMAAGASAPFMLWARSTPSTASRTSGLSAVFAMKSLTRAAVSGASGPVGRYRTAPAGTRSVRYGTEAETNGERTFGTGPPSHPRLTFPRSQSGTRTNWSPWTTQPRGRTVCECACDDPSASARGRGVPPAVARPGNSHTDSSNPFGASVRSPKVLLQFGPERCLCVRHPRPVEIAVVGSHRSPIVIQAGEVGRLTAVPANVLEGHRSQPMDRRLQHRQLRVAYVDQIGFGGRVELVIDDDRARGAPGVGQVAPSIYSHCAGLKHQFSLAFCIEHGPVIGVLLRGEEQVTKISRSHVVELVGPGVNEPTVRVSCY
ncbi:hypothetical protein MICABA_02834 [Microbacterium sp. T2.11-28]|nr:hypothetical protein MICABA_02834 [Microbacterium sp. T2.11-28]